MTEVSPLLRKRNSDNYSAARRLGAADRAKEGSLYLTKWFDYRFVSPLDATLQFRKHFSEVFQRKYRINFDRDESVYKMGVSRGLIKPLELTSLWRARQFADELGVPYNVFLDAAFEVLLRRGWKRLPYPNQLYGTRQRQAIADAVLALWRERCESMLTISTMPAYREESYRGLAAQDSHREWVLSHLKVSHGRPFSIGSACFLYRVLPANIATEAFGSERIDRAALEVADRERVEHCPAGAFETLPSCFGLPAAMDAASPTCVSCSRFRLCAQMCTLLLRSIGSQDPVGDRKRHQQRARTRRFRARAKRTTLPHGGTSSPDPSDPTRGGPPV